jgi:hypothetical protein
MMPIRSLIRAQSLAREPGENAMAEGNTLAPAELAALLSSIAGSHGGTASRPDDDTVSGTLTAITSRWFLGGRKVTSSFTCRLDAATHEAHFRESAVERSWGLPPPTFTVETTSQSGARVSTTRTDKSPGGGGTLAFGRFRESVERAVQDAGWKFLFEVG